MINPETNLLCIARRVLAMADRIGNTAIPEEIANEARDAQFALASIADESELRWRTSLLCIRLRRYCDEPSNSLAQETYKQSLKVAAENLRGAIRMEELHRGEREAA